MVRFHVVNSVKGGCGKSTFSLYLANHLTAMGHKTVIIDLDIGGSTWYRGFKQYLVRSTTEPDETDKEADFRKEETKFLNDLLYEYEKNKDDEWMSGFPDRDNHIIDATRYATERVSKTFGSSA